MIDAGQMAKVLEAFARGVAEHDRVNPTHTTWGIGMAHFDIERLGLEDGEEILPGIVLKADGGQASQFRILCDGQHDHEEEIEEEEEAFLEVVAEEEIEVPAYSPGPNPVPPTP